MKAQSNVLVTGVSSGIGLAITESLTARNIRVFGSVRSQRDAERLLDTFKDQVVPLIFDTTDRDAVTAASEQVRELLKDDPLLGIVNNAGTGTAAPLLHVPIAEFRQQLEVNVIGTLNVIQQFLPLIQGSGKRPGRIVNIGSTAGRIGIPFFGAYAASKHALTGLSESLRRELMLYGVDVITVVPGPVKTAIWDKAEALNFSAYSDTPYVNLIQAFRDAMVRDGRNGMEPRIIGDTVFTALTAKRPKATYIRVAGLFSNWILPTRLPSRWVDKLIGDKVGLKLLSGPKNLRQSATNQSR
ncbi:NAD(P)-dependent dehydrogenase (short-subunit alcohol dehydrogenase family) [Granulicella aggregans]|uniref:NAD(P)-dependent dehydrogenase (Short-subunit alcohol dehydrogenase family) n=1 Tax=Granulicella aggregans TaxID=474949 RepID=A0A7W8E6G2_9BACT|nr:MULTISPECIES: SDR family NAD(P)-dependent oxidoreductase [Granulicella]MBB5060646.1 NAD(P)-dependent dehydrogenase (short-subunit alcohol dehydrogenase family) [Granulicella aggregans]